MKHINHLSRFCSFFISFTLLISPLPLPAFAQAMADRPAFAKAEFILSSGEGADRPAIIEGIQPNLSEFEIIQINESPESTYLYLGQDASNIKRVVQRLSDFDTDLNSPLHQLKTHLEDGFVIGESDAIKDAVEYAQITLDKHYKQLNEAEVQEINSDIDTLVNQIINGDLTLSTKTQVYDPLETKVINKNLDVLGKSKFRKNATFYDNVYIKKSLTVDHNAHFHNNIYIKKDLTVDHNAHFHDNVYIKKAIKADKGIFKKLTVKDCINNLCVNDLSVVDLVIS